MARDREPVTDEDVAQLRERMDAQREDIRKALAEELGGDPGDYEADHPVADGGED